MAQQIMIVANGFEPSTASSQQIAGLTQCIEQLRNDPRVQVVYGLSGHSSGCAVIAEVTDRQEGEEIAGFLAINGFPEVQTSYVLPAQQMWAGLKQAQRSATGATLQLPKAKAKATAV